MGLVDSLVAQGWLKTPKIIEAFREIDRVDFLPKKLKGSSQLNRALPIGKGQTISQPLVVAFMIELLGPEKGDKILDIGAGSGYSSALLAHIVSQRGKVIAIEIIPELKRFGEKNVSKYSFIKKGVVEFICADGAKGYPNYTSRDEFSEGFDKILASAAADKIPQAWKNQLKKGGKIVAPVGSSIFLLIKESEGNFKTKEYRGFRFVPLVEK